MLAGAILRPTPRRRYVSVQRTSRPPMFVFHRLAETPSPCAGGATADTPPPDEPRRVGSDAEAPRAEASAAVRARPFAAVPATARRGTRFLRTQPAESGGSVFFLAGPRSPSFRHFVSRGTIATVASRTAQLLHILVPCPHRLARVRSIGEIEPAGLAGIAARTCRAICGGDRARDSPATARSPFRPNRDSPRECR